MLNYLNKLGFVIKVIFGVSFLGCLSCMYQNGDDGVILFIVKEYIYLYKVFMCCWVIV